MNVEKEKAIQGNADGLCGLYALANFLIVKGEVSQGYPAYGTEARHEAVRYIWEACERLNLLTASKLYSGYEWPDLAAVFNEYARYNSYPYVAVPLRSLRDRLPSRFPGGILNAAIQDGGGAVFPVDKNSHWILVYDRRNDGQFKVADPTVSKPLKSVEGLSSAEDGIAILPVNSQFAKGEAES